MSNAEAVQVPEGEWVWGRESGGGGVGCVKRVGGVVGDPSVS
jgi:hypothetical protein